MCDGLQYLETSLSKFAYAVTLRTCIREVPSSRLGQNTDSPDIVLKYFSSVPSGKYWNGTKNPVMTTYFIVICSSLFSVTPVLDIVYSELMAAS